jgi:RNase P/RNase MRP subunit p30
VKKYPRGYKWGDAGIVKKDFKFDGYRLLIVHGISIKFLYEAVTRLKLDILYGEYSRQELEYIFKKAIRVARPKLLVKLQTAKPKLPYITQQDIEELKIRLLVEEV